MASENEMQSRRVLSSARKNAVEESSLVDDRVKGVKRGADVTLYFLRFSYSIYDCNVK